jgi:hypothetical protein
MTSGGQTNAEAAAGLHINIKAERVCLLEHAEAQASFTVTWGQGYISHVTTALEQASILGKSDGGGIHHKLFESQETSYNI